MSSSLIDPLDRHHYMRVVYTVHCSRANKTGWRTLARTRPPLPLGPPRTPRPAPRDLLHATVLPELRRIVTGLDMPALCARPSGPRTPPRPDT
ncbi:unnamed protein product, partial [Brenthis ino]